MPAVAITDTGNLFGALEFSQAAPRKGVQPIIGCQIALARADKPRLPPDPLVLLAQNAAGFANLQRLSSVGFLETDPGAEAADLRCERLAEHAEGLFLLTGGTSGPIGRLLAEGQRAEAAASARALRRGVPRTAWRWNCTATACAVERAIEPGLIALADAARPAAGRHQRLLLRQPRDARGA